MTVGDELRHHALVGDRVRFGLCVAVIVGGCLASPIAGDDLGASPAETPPANSATGDPPAGSGPTESPSFVRPTPNPSPTFLIHEVRPGESLTSIARLYGTTARSIAYWNRDAHPSLDPDSEGYEPNRIVVGWTLRVIPTEVVDEDELPDPTPTPVPTPASPSPGSSSGAS